MPESVIFFFLPSFSSRPFIFSVITGPVLFVTCPADDDCHVIFVLIKFLKGQNMLMFLQNAIIKAFGILKRSAAEVNIEYGLRKDISDLIVQASDEVC